MNNGDIVVFSIEDMQNAKSLSDIYIFVINIYTLLQYCKLNFYSARYKKSNLLIKGYNKAF